MSVESDIKKYLDENINSLKATYPSKSVVLLNLALAEINRLQALIDAVGAADNNILHRLKTENNNLSELLDTAAGLLFRLEEYNCINTDDEQFESELDHWREIGRYTVKQARSLLNDRTDAQKL